MFENEEKGWYGSYSLAGRRSAEKFHNILYKTEILKGETKKIKIQDIFAPDEIKTNPAEEQLDYYKIYSMDINNLKKKIKQKYNEVEKSKEKKENKKFNLFFHNRHCSLENKKIGITTHEPGCTRYSPNYNYIWPKLITGIKWGDQMGRKYKKIEKDNRDFIINNLENYDKYIINSGFVKCFVNMNSNEKKKKILKKIFKINNNTKERSLIKRFTKKSPDKEKNEIKKDYNTTNNFSHPNTFSDKKIKTRNKNLVYKKNNNSTNELKMKFLGQSNKNLLSESKILKSDKKNKTSYLESMKEEEDLSQITPKKLQGYAPNFAKLQSREKKVKTYRIENIPFIFPKYSFVQERSLTMTVYKKEKPTKKYKNNPFKGIISGLDYDPDKVIEKFNNHKSPKVPLFKNMTSRPNKKGSPLPSFLQNVHDRSSPYLTTDKSLKLNNYAEGKYIPASNFFFPKKSYNKIINMKLANSKMFKQKSLDEDIQNKKNQVTQKLKLEGANYEELKSEGALNKFDNFCYKTILRRKPRENRVKFLMSFESEGKEDNEK